MRMYSDCSGFIVSATPGTLCYTLPQNPIEDPALIAITLYPAALSFQPELLLSSDVSITALARIPGSASKAQKVESRG